MSSYRDDLLKELSNAQRTLQKYEDKILKGEVATEDKEYFQSRVEFWSNAVLELRKALFSSQANVGRPAEL